MKGNKLAEGWFDLSKIKFGIVVSNWNEQITNGLLDGAVRFVKENLGTYENIVIMRCPGAFEMPLTCQKVIEAHNVDGVIALGCIIRGDTPHFDFVANGTANGIMQVMLQKNVPIGFGVLTTNTEEQAVMRSLADNTNKGYEAAQAVSEMILLKPAEWTVHQRLHFGL